MGDANENDNGGDSSGLGGWGDGPGWGDGGAAVDSTIAGSPPNAGMTAREQLEAYGAGRQAAELAAGYGLGGPALEANAGNYSSKAGTINTVAATPAPTVGGMLREVGAFLGAVLGIANPSPAGKATGLGYFADRIGGMATVTDPDAGKLHDLGFAGNLGATNSGASVGGLEGSPAPGRVADGPGALEGEAVFSGAGIVNSSPVLGWQGAIVSYPVLPTQPIQLRMASPAAVKAASQQANPAAPLLLAGLGAYLIGA